MELKPYKHGKALKICQNMSLFRLATVGRLVIHDQNGVLVGAASVAPGGIQAAQTPEDRARGGAFHCAASWFAPDVPSRPMYSITVNGRTTAITAVEAAGQINLAIG